MKFDSEQDVKLEGAFTVAGKKGPKAVLEKLCGLTEQDLLWNSILEVYNLFENNVNINEIIDLTFELKRK